MQISNRKWIVIITIVLVLSLAVSGILWLGKPSGTQVVITVNGQVYGSYDLHTDQTVTVGPTDGSWHNTLTIRSGKAAITESDCSNQICVNTPALSEDTIGLIVCLPHGLVAELKNSTE